MSPWDAIIIGSGLGGLTAGAILARQGKRVLILERHHQAGGAATGFSRAGVMLEVGLHALDGMDEVDGKKNLLEKLGVLEQIKLVPLPEFYSAQGGCLTQPITLPHGGEAAQRAMELAFPHHKKALARYFGILAAYRQALIAVTSPQKGLWAKLTLPLRIWPLIRYEKTSLSQFLERLFGADEEIQLALTANLGYYSDNPEEMAFGYFAIAQASYIFGGGWFIQGGSRKLSDALKQIIEEEGGQVRLRREATEILFQEGKLCGVGHSLAPRVGSRDQQALSGAEEDFAPVVIANAAPAVIQNMLPQPWEEVFMQPYQKFKPATSLWTLYLVLSQSPREFGVKHYSTFLFPPGLKKLRDYGRHPLEHNLDQPPMMVLVDYSAIDSGLGGPGKFVASLCGVDRLSIWEALGEGYQEKKQQFQMLILQGLEERFPGIGGSILHAELATAKTMKDYLNSPGGTAYGFAQTPNCAGRLRPKAKTKIPGLFLASAFAQPGGGFTGAIFAGALAANAVNQWKGH